MTSESRYLVRLIRGFVRGEQAPIAPDEPIDGARFHQLLLTHRLLLTVNPLIPDQAVSEEVLHDLRGAARAHRLRAALLQLELARFLPALEELGARPIALKGAALSTTVYDGNRFFSDLDVLVDRTRLEDVYEALRSFGYEATDTLRHREFYERHHFHRHMTSPMKIPLEIHWDLTRPSDYVRLDVEGFFARAVPARLGGLTIRIPCDADQLLHGASQFLREGFSDLRRVVDTALLLQAGAAADPELAGRARRAGLAPALWVLLRSTREVSGAPQATELETALRPHGLQRRLLDGVGIGEIAAGRGFGGVPHRPGMRSFLNVVCAPDRAVALRELKALVRVDRARLLDGGHDPGDLPGLGYRALLGAKRSLAFLSAARSQFWRVLSHRA